jgi:hypothetical protein
LTHIVLPTFKTLPKTLAKFAERNPLVTLLATVAYIISPIDILPEAILGPLGGFDDILVSLAAIALLKLGAKSRAEHRRLNPPAPKPVPAPPPPPPSQRHHNDQPRRGRHFWKKSRRHEERNPHDRRPENRHPHDRPQGDRNRDRGGRPNRPGDRRP